MKTALLNSAFALLGFVLSETASAQNLAPDQNPSFAVSRDKYMRMADSINQWHTTTFQQTYKAYDWYEARQERRQDRQQFRRELRLERARGYRYYNNHPSYYYQPHSGYYRHPQYRNFWWF